MSQPPTPSPTASREMSNWRFHPITAPTEWIEHYRPGGLHPIHLGDTLDSDRYTILRKLDYGSFSTVRLARDAWSACLKTLICGASPLINTSFRECRYVAIKVSVAKASETNNELEILQHLARRRDQGGARYVMEMLSSFAHEGPNGRHLCLCFL